MHTMEEYGAGLAEVRRLTGLEMLVPDDGGLVTVRVDDKYNLSLQYIEGPARVLCFIEIAELPADAPKRVYRELLAGGLFGTETAGGFFTLEPESETVIYNYFFDGVDAARDPEAFVQTLEDMLQLCDIWTERIEGILSGVPEDGLHPEAQGSIQVFA
ncbi:MAG: type III secretion system chaperone [Mailhella sp.]|nr:type III secretion system chaperone [Mailhella sp.]